MLSRIKTKLKSRLHLDPYYHLRRQVIVLNNVQELKKVFGWQHDPILDDPQLYEYKLVVDANDRKLRDFESVTAVARNSNPTTCLDIGTGTGSIAAMLALNAPQAQIHTLNIPPESFDKGGKLTTMKLERDQIGTYYRQRKFENINQIFANTATWTPDIGKIDLSFIDGSHDTRFVINDTLKILPHMPPGSFLMWHDFNLTLAPVYHWIDSVCRGVEYLLAHQHIQGRIFQIKDSWTAIYQKQR